MIEQTARLIIPDENIPAMVLNLCKSNYWVKLDPLQDGKTLMLIRKDED